MRNIKIVTLICSLSLYVTQMNAQETVAAAGMNHSGVNGSVSATLGQVFCSPHASVSAFLIEGVQQPYEISVITSVHNYWIPQIDICVYPNPATDRITISVNNEGVDNLAFRLNDAKSALLDQGNITDSETPVEMLRYTTGTYYLSVFRSGVLIRSFKIVKF